MSPNARTRLRSAAIQAVGLLCFLAPFALASMWTGGEGL